MGQTNFDGSTTLSERATPTATLDVASGLWAAIPAALLGLFILFGVGFANSTTLHNAAHDSRHAYTYPCH